MCISVLLRLWIGIKKLLTLADASLQVGVVSIYWPGKYKNNLPSLLHFQSKENDLISILEEEAGLK